MTPHRSGQRQSPTANRHEVADCSSTRIYLDHYDLPVQALTAAVLIIWANQDAFGLFVVVYCCAPMYLTYTGKE